MEIEVKNTIQNGHSQLRIDHRNGYESSRFGLFIDGKHAGDFKRKRNALLAKELLELGHIDPALADDDNTGIESGQLIEGIGRLAKEVGGYHLLDRKWIKVFDYNDSDI